MILEALWPKAKRPQFLQEEAYVNSLSLERLLTIKKFHTESKNDEKENDGKILVDGTYPDEPIPAERDNGREYLHKARLLRKPLLEPKMWYQKVPVKREPIIRNLPLEACGGANQVSVQTIEDCHDRRVKLTLRQFFRGNWNVGGRPKTETLKSEDGTLKRLIDFDWDNPQSLNNIQEAVANYMMVWLHIWPQDDTPIAFLKLLIRYKWIGAGSNMFIRREIISALFEFITSTNGTRAGNGQPPMTYDEMEKQLKIILQTNGVSSEIPLDRIPRKNPAGQQATSPSRAQSSTSSNNQAGNSKDKPKSDPSNAKLKDGSQVCFGYNSKSRPCRNSHATGGCTNRLGRFFAHNCNYYFEKEDKFCLGKHSFCNGKGR